MDAPLFEFGLGIARRLDARFGRTTVAAKMTDVPGHTRAMVPLLAAGGIEFLHLGINGSCPLPETPPIFRWRDTASGREIVTAYSGDYGGLITAPGCAEALYFAHTGDNNGPPSVANIHATFAALRARYPDVLVAASMLDAFAAALRPARGQLPVVTSEIGDTWIHGVASDPAKTAELRALLQWRAGLPDPLAPELDGLNENLLLTAEHTWGLDTKITAFGFFGKDYDREFCTAEFRARRVRPDYQRLESSWAEQRAYLRGAVDALPTAALRDAAKAAVARTHPREEPAGEPLAAGTTLDARHFRIAVDPESGALRELTHVGRTWFSAKRPLGRLHYEAFSSQDYDWLWEHYSVKHAETEDWAKPDFLKPGLENVVPRSRRWPARLRRLSRLPADEEDAATYECSLLAEGDFGLTAEEARVFGAPGRWQIRYRFPTDRPAVEIAVQWFDKPAVRLAEAIWLESAPVTGQGNWALVKLGTEVDPADVVRHGNRRLHGADAAIYREAGGAGLRCSNPDGPLVAPGGPALVRYQDTSPDLALGPWFNLYNNTWGTNLPM